MKKKLLIAGVITAYLSIAAACSNGSSSGSMADNKTGNNSQNESSVQDNNLTADKGTGTNNGITGTGGARSGDNISLWDDAGNAIGETVDDVMDGISDLLGGNDNGNASDTTNGTMISDGTGSRISARTETGTLTP